MPVKKITNNETVDTYISCSKRHCSIKSDAGTGLQLPGKHPWYRLVVPHTNIFTYRRNFTFPSSKIKCTDVCKMLWKRGCEFSVPFLTAGVTGRSPEEQNTVPVSSHGAQHLRGTGPQGHHGPPAPPANHSIWYRATKRNPRQKDSNQCLTELQTKLEFNLARRIKLC